MNGLERPVGNALKSGVRVFIIAKMHFCQSRKKQKETLVVRGGKLLMQMPRTLLRRLGTPLVLFPFPLYTKQNLLSIKKKAPTHYGVSGPVGNRIKSAFFGKMRPPITA